MASVTVYKCLQCDFESLRRADTRRHLSQRHFVERIRCPASGCDKSSKQLENFKTHWRTHLGDEGKIYEPVCRNANARARDTTQIDRHWDNCAACKDLASEGQKRFIHLPETFTYPQVTPESSGVNNDDYIEVIKTDRADFDTRHAQTRRASASRGRRATSGQNRQNATSLAEQRPLPAATTTTTTATATTTPMTQSSLPPAHQQPLAAPPQTQGSGVVDTSSIDDFSFDVPMAAFTAEDQEAILSPPSPAPTFFDLLQQLPQQQQLGPADPMFDMEDTWGWRQGIPGLVTGLEAFD